ncbi:MAG: hypothetical protein UT63_C0116G0006, partial [Candidatus Gottesmanbacteria bacterium GW2011_GWC2_39_8]
LPGEIEMAVKMRPTCTWTKRPRGALLQLGIGKPFLTVENRWEPSGNSGIPLFENVNSNRFAAQKSGSGTVSGGQFNWGGFLQNSNGDAQRYA